MNLFFRVAGVVSLVGVVGAQGVRPPRTNPPVDHAAIIKAQTAIPPQARAAINRACRDCHSNETQWPWYSGVAPMSWFVIDHVNHGRRRLNFSEWTRYEPGRVTDLLTKVCEEVQAGGMPLSSYTLIHRQARLTATDISAICDWVDATRTKRVPN